MQVCTSRLNSGWESSLLNRDAVLERLQVLVEKEPDRFEKLMSPDTYVRLYPAYYLQLYIKDALNRKPSDKPKVSVRNKFYSAVFGDEFESVFEHIGFERVTENGEEFVQLPLIDSLPHPPPRTAMRSKRAFLEVIRAHLCCLLMQGSQVPGDHLGIDLPPAAPVLTRVLDAGYDTTSFSNWEDYPEASFDALGARRDMSEWLLCYAATSQNGTNPSGRREVYDALMSVCSNRETRNPVLADLLNQEQEWLATEMSKEQGFSHKDSFPEDAALALAYSFFGANDSMSDDAILTGFGQMTDPYDTHRDRTARHCLYLIAKSRKSLKLKHPAGTFDDPEKACEYLSLSPEATPDYAAAHIAVIKDTEEYDIPTVVQAAKVLAESYYRGHPELPQLLQYIATLEAEAAKSWRDIPSGDGSSSSAGADQVSPTIPAGLDNIRNTCYLNSILQYFNTIVPVRDVILNWETYKLVPTDENIRSRRLGGSGSELDRGKAFLAGRFVEEMRSLFVEIQNSDRKSVKPKQRLALAAMNSAKQLVEIQTKTTARPFIGPELPPKLPPRPASTPPANAPTGPTVSVNPVGDTTDTASDVSSVTLVGDDKSYVELSGSVPPTVPAKQRSALDDDVRDTGDDENIARGRSMTREGESEDDQSVAKPLSLEEQIQAALNNEETTGTDQQDIEEVMGNILEHLHAAIKPTSTDESTGLQTDIITETFYWSSKMDIRDLDLQTGQVKGEPRAKTDLSRWITAFPADKEKTDLYTALDRSFDREHGELNSKLSEMYTSITRSPPILHIYIQRSRNVGGRLDRNNHAVEIPETLYLDRYMDSSNGSDIMKKRQRSWNLKGRLQTLNNPPAKSPSTDPANNDGGSAVQEVGYQVIDANLDVFADAIMSLDTGEGDDTDEFVSVLDADSRKRLEDAQLLAPTPDGATAYTDPPTCQQGACARLDFAASKRAYAQVEAEKAAVQEELSSLFTDMKEVSYCLHAVICHGGGVSSGHYWVWIYDFQRKIWRKYNDETVTEHSDGARVLADLSNSGNPYYLAYVRENMIDSLVTINKRTPQPKTIGNAYGQSGDADGPVGADPAESGDGSGQIGNSAQVRHALPTGRPEDPMQIDGEMAVMHVEDRDD